MLRKLRPRLTYANVVSTLCLFLLLGGGAWAATQLPRNSVGTKQLKRESVTTVKIGKGAVTGPKIDLSSLGTVPSAVSAARATQAESAAKAVQAESATTAGHAETAGSAALASSLSPPEPLHFVGTPGEPALESGWGTSPTESPVVFWKDHECMVHLAGVLNGPTESVAFALPPAYHPFQESNFVVIRPSTLILPGWAIVEEGDGKVRLYGGSTGMKYTFALDNISFRAATC